jgi:hypothetical protein
MMVEHRPKNFSRAPFSPPRQVKTRLPAKYQNFESNSKTSAFLGLFSIGLGLVETIAPKSFSKFIGADHDPALLRGYGLREIAAGVGILAGKHPTTWLLSRVAGDAIDLATLAKDLSEATGERRNRVLAATAAVVGVTVLDVLTAAQGRGTCD